MFCISVPAVVGWLWTAGLLNENVEATMSGAPFYPEIETDSLGFAFISADQFFNEGSLEGEEGSRTTIGSPTSISITDITAQQGNLVYHDPDGTSLALQSGDLLTVDGTHSNGSPPTSPPHNGKGGWRGVRASLSTALVFLVVCLGLLTSRSFRMRAGRKNAGIVYAQQKQPKQERSTVAGSMEVHQLDALQQLQPLATQLAEVVGIDASLAALWDFRSSVQKGKQAQRNILRGSVNTSESSERLVKQALREGVSALSRLYEVARQHSFSLAQKTQKFNDITSFSEAELRAMGGYLGPAFAGLLEFHLESLGSSLATLVKNSEGTEKEVKGLREFKGVEDRRLLAAAIADVEFIRAAHEAAEGLNQLAIALRSKAVTTLLSHFRREQICIQRQCRDMLEEQRALWQVERQRQLSLSSSDSAALEELDAVEEELRKGRQLLQTHREKIEFLAKQKDIPSAQAAGQQANAVGQDLKALLQVVASRIAAISGPSGTREASQDKEVQFVMHSLTLEASREAATAADIVGSTRKALELQKAVAPPFLWMRQNQGRKSNDANNFINPSVERLVKDWLQKVADNARAVARQAASAAAGTTQKSSESPFFESHLAASKATMLAEALGQEAELLELRAQLITSMKFVMQVSDNLARRAAAAVEAQGEEEEQQQWHVVLSPDEILQVQALLDQVQLAKEEAWSQRSLRALAVAAAAMKEASFELTSIIQGREKL